MQKITRVITRKYILHCEKVAHKIRLLVISCVWSDALFSMSLINQWGKIYRADIPQKLGIGTLSPSRTVARNLWARRISSVLCRVALIRAWNWVLQYSICRGRAVFPFQRLVPATLGSAYSDHFSIAYRALREIPEIPRNALFWRVKGCGRENCRVSAAFDRSIANTVVYTRIDHIYCRCLVASANTSFL